MEEKDVRNRLQQLLKERDISINKLANMTGIGYTTINYQIQGNSKFTLQVLLAILGAMPDVSADWLLRGASPAHVINNVHKNSGITNVGGTQTVAAPSQDLIAEKEKRIEELTKDKEYLMGLVTNLTKR